MVGAPYIGRNIFWPFVRRKHWWIPLCISLPPPLFCFFLHHPTHIFSPSPSFFLSPRVVTQIPLLLSPRRCPMGDKTKQRRMSGVVKKRGKEFTPPFPFFSFLSLVCLFFLTRSRKRRKREGTTTKKEDFMKPCLSFLFKKHGVLATTVSAKWELSFFAQYFPFRLLYGTLPRRRRGAIPEIYDIAPTRLFPPPPPPPPLLSGFTAWK